LKFGPLEIILILLVILIIFGAGKLPQLFEMFGRWKNDLKKNKEGNAEELEEHTRLKPKRKIKKIRDDY
jgi:sec-independent protein translocase protein TatA